jgi:hypothetical protein
MLLALLLPVLCLVQFYAPSIRFDNLQAMEDAIYMVNIYGKDFPSDIKAKLDIYTYKILKAQQRHKQPVSTIHHYYHEQKEGQDLFSTVKQMHETLRRIEDMANANNMQHQTKDIDTNNKEQSEQGDTATSQDAA